MFPLKNTEAYIHANGYRSTLGKELAARDAEISELGSEIQALTNEVKEHWSEGGRNILAIDPDYVLTIPTGTESAINVATVNVTQGTTYTFSCMQDNAVTSNTRNTLQASTNGQDFFESSNTNFHLASGRHVLTFTAPATGTCTLRMWGHTLSTQTTYSQFMLEEGSTATEYEPYAKTNMELTADISGYNQRIRVSSSITTIRDMIANVLTQAESLLDVYGYFIGDIEWAGQGYYLAFIRREGSNVTHALIVGGSKVYTGTNINSSLSSAYVFEGTSIL